MLSASEPLSSEIPRAWMNEFDHPAQHVHMFGQTETAGIVAMFRIPRDFDGDKFVPVGGPIANTDIYVLDENRHAGFLSRGFYRIGLPQLAVVI
jgi:non-ribosomal peptide synthetase component F